MALLLHHAFWCSVAKPMRMNITLIALFTSHPAYTTGLQYQLPAYNLAIDEISRVYDFNVTLVSIYSPDIRTCDDLARYNYRIAEYYYQAWDRTSQLVIIGAGCDEMELLAQLARGL